MRLEFVEFVKCHDSYYGIESIGWTADGEHLITVCRRDVIFWKWPEMEKVITTGFNYDQCNGNNKIISTDRDIFLVVENNKLIQITEFDENVIRFNEIVGVHNNEKINLSKDLVFDRKGKFAAWTQGESTIVGEFHRASHRIIIKNIYTHRNQWNVTDMNFSPDIKLVISIEKNTYSANYDTDITWEYNFKNNFRSGINSRLSRTVFSPNSRYLVCLCQNEIEVYKWKNKELYKTIPLPVHTRIRGSMNGYNILFEKTGKFLICNTYYYRDSFTGEHYLLLIDWKKEIILQEFELPNIKCLGLSPCGNFLLVGERNVGLAVYKLNY